MRLLYLVIDGIADRPQDGVTTLQRAVIKGLNHLVRRAKCGLMYTLGRGVAPESDSAVMSILGYDPNLYYTGRGPLETLGAGIRIAPGREVAFRANFATVNESTMELIDRRCGRSLSSEEASELAAALNGMSLSRGSYVKVEATIGYRVVVVIGAGTQLSGNVSNTDPAYIRQERISIAAESFEKKIAECRPLDDTPEAMRTADLVNEFTLRASSILKNHPVNLERERKDLLKANAILMRDSGSSLPPVEPIGERWGLSFAAVVEMPIEMGIARLFQMEVGEVPPPSEDKEEDYSIRLEKTLELLHRNDIVYVHLKEPDEPGHDGDLEAKVRSLELIDEHYVQPLLERIDLDEVAVLVTSDHATPWTRRAHTDDPVPVMLAVPGQEADGIEAFQEDSCSEGSLGTLEHGWELLPRVFDIIRVAPQTKDPAQHRE